jgi:hypothetical protein
MPRRSARDPERGALGRRAGAAGAVALAAILLGAGPGGAQDPEAAFRATLEALPRSVFHIVAEGETLATIAEYYLGDPKLAPQLLAANRVRLKDRRRLVPGMTIEVPVPRDWQPREPLEHWRARALKAAKPRPAPGGTPAAAPRPARTPPAAAAKPTPEPARIVIVPAAPTPSPVPSPAVGPAATPGAPPRPGVMPGGTPAPAGTPRQ